MVKRFLSAGEWSRVAGHPGTFSSRFNGFPVMLKAVKTASSSSLCSVTWLKRGGNEMHSQSRKELFRTLPVEEGDMKLYTSWLAA